MRLLVTGGAGLIAEAAEVLGFSPRFSLRDGLAELVQGSVKASSSAVASKQESRDGSVELNMVT
jgi:hypothetical protein